MACTIYVTLICNVVIFKGIYKQILLNLLIQAQYSSPDIISRPGGFSRHTG